MSPSHSTLERTRSLLEGAWASAIDGSRAGASPATERRALRSVAMIGNHTPRQCGIATFTADLTEAIALECPELECFVIAMDDPGTRHDYPKRVRLSILERDVDSYRRAARFLNASSVDVVSLQHEYGIFGGDAGGHILVLLRELRIPIVTTLHTILAEPNPAQAVVMNEIVRRSERLVVMSKHGAELLRRVHGVPADKIDLIPHGISRLDQSPSAKRSIGAEGKRVILTFGLLSPDKGLEYVIDAMPAILARYPDATYVVLGATHPHVRARAGEGYRRMLEERVRELGIESNVTFHDRFVSRSELAEFLSAADVYVTPYLKLEQITSGTLAYAVGSGKAVISTPYWYANELLADGRGTLVPVRDAAAIAQAALELFGDDSKRTAMCRRAAAFGRNMTWPVVGRAYTQSFERACRAATALPRWEPAASVSAGGGAALPAINLDHIERLTDDTGLLQHAAYTVPRREDGYCLDDNARALLVTVLAERGGHAERARLAGHEVRYLAFVRHAWNPRRGRFRNFMSYSRRWRERCGSEDSHGRALWALGTLLGRATDSGRRDLARELFRAALPAVAEFTSPRAWAFALLGLAELLRGTTDDVGARGARDDLAERLLSLWQRTNEHGWPWFEDRVTYCSARLSQALLTSGAAMERVDMTAAGLGSLEWLFSVQRSPSGCFAPVGSNGFYLRGGTMARFDQQPVEAAAMLSACLDAYRLTHDERWAEHGRSAYDWFLGQNDLGLPLYDAESGGCRDGLHEDRANENQGAESTLSFLLAQLEMRALLDLIPAQVAVGCTS